MKQFLIASMALLAIAGVSRASYDLSFLSGTSTVTGDTNEDTLTLAINTAASTASATGSSDDAGVTEWLALSGTGTQQDAFTLNVEMGFAFDPDAPSYDTTDYDDGDPVTENDADKNTFRFRRHLVDEIPVNDGLAPLGKGVGFSGISVAEVTKAEILFFTISDLGAGESFVLEGYTLKESNASRIDLYYGAGLTFFDTLDAVTDVSAENIVLANGDQFGFGYDRHAGNRSALQSITFDIVGGTTPVSGDYDDSGQVEQGDLDLVLLNWGDDTGSIVGWVNDAPEAGQPVGNEQLTVVRTNWGNTAAGATAGVVPEPTTAALLAIGMLAAARVRRRRCGWG